MEKVLFEFKQWDNKKFPCTLITYDNGSMDLHAQTGDGHREAIKKAKKILMKKGLKVGKADGVGMTGMYYPVNKIKRA